MNAAPYPPTPPTFVSTAPALPAPSDPPAVPIAPVVPPRAPTPQTAPVRAPPARGWRDWAPIRIWKRQFPPVRLVWIFLLVIVWNGRGLTSGAVVEPLLALPLLCALTDVGLQASRFPRLRVPDAAIANGLFLSVILWPTAVSIELAAVACATVGLRHLLRSAGHPWLNPAALGVTVAASVFALPQPWHVGVSLSDTVLVAALGLVLWSRARHSVRLFGSFFAANLASVGLLALELGGRGAVPVAVEAALLGPAPVFYALFMVTEPRTAPSARTAMVVFGVLVGASAAAFPVVFALVPILGPLGVLAPYLALFAGNAFAVAARARPRGHPSRAPARPSTA